MQTIAYHRTAYAIIWRHHHDHSAQGESLIAYIQVMRNALSLTEISNKLLKTEAELVTDDAAQ